MKIVDISLRKDQQEEFCRVVPLKKAKYHSLILMKSRPNGQERNVNTILHYFLEIDLSRTMQLQSLNILKRRSDQATTS